MTRNIWTRALWGGILGIAAADLILVLGGLAKAVNLNLLASLSNLLTSGKVAWSPSGMILGFVLHLLIGAFWAIIVAAVVRSFRSRHNIVSGVINGLFVWLVWGLALPPLGLGPAPWSVGTSTTVFTLAASLTYGVIVGYALSDEAVRTDI